jgi:hypothetical protein
MAATDHTLLARLGFADPDRKDPLHDWACQYLAQPEVLNRLVAPRSVDQSSIRLETYITKGSGQYKTTIGFADLTALVFHPKKLEVNSIGYDGSTSLCTYRYTSKLIVEVKITKTSIGDVLRQLSLYREFTPQPDGAYPHPDGHIVFLVSAYALDETDVAALSREKISHAVLGPGFKEFVERRAANTTVKNVVI